MKRILIALLGCMALHANASDLATAPNKIGGTVFLTDAQPSDLCLDGWHAYRTTWANGDVAGIGCYQFQGYDEIAAVGYVRGATAKVYHWKQHDFTLTRYGQGLRDAGIPIGF